MLMLLNMHQAVMLCLFWSKKISDPFEPDTNTRVFEDPGLKFSYFITQWALQNGIESDELPALKKPKNKSLEKKFHKRAGVPEEIADFLPKQHDYWITYSDLVAFANRPDQVSDNDYAHARESLARVAWVLAKQHTSAMEQTALFEYLDQLVDGMTQNGLSPDLGETTLKGCVREILAAGQSIEKKS